MENSELLNTVSFNRLIIEAQRNTHVPCSVYNQGCMVVPHVSAKDISEGEGMFASPSRLNAMIFFLCTEGEISFTCDLDQIKISRGMAFTVRPGSILQCDFQSNCNGSLIICDEKLLISLNIQVQKMLEHLPALDNGKKWVMLSSEQMDYTLTLLNLLARSINQSDSLPYYHENIRSLITAFFYAMLSIASTKMEKLDAEVEKCSGRNEEYFRTFIQLVKENFRQHRKITFYAEKMCITPKYLSTLIRQFSGRGPSEWIDMCVIMEAKNLLRYGEMSIQEVAYYLGFPTQSFFGRYFKAHTGLSPKSFKMQG